jgi:lipopolysaccharide export system permease protein
MSLLDRYILRSLAFNYIIALGVMMTLYVILDLFINMDEFTEDPESWGTVVAGMASYYGHNLFLYFAQLSGVITLFACLASVARMRRQNELTAVLASGVSLYRVAAPVVAFGLLTSGLWFLDTEVIIPQAAHKLARRHDDALGKKSYGVWFLRDRGNALLCAQNFDPTSEAMKRLLVLYRDAEGRVAEVLEAEEARWQPIADNPSGGIWELARGIKRSRVVGDPGGLSPGESVRQVPIAQYQSELDPEGIQLRQSSQWVEFVSTAQLSRLVAQGDISPSRLQQLKHRRFAMPIVNLVLLLLGLPLVLDRTPGNILRDSARCLAVCGLCFLMSFAGQSIEMQGSLAALPSWLPIFLFAPVVVVLLDRVKT